MSEFLAATREECTVLEALSAVPNETLGNPVVGLLYSVEAAFFARWDGSGLWASDGVKVDLGPVFEARLFGSVGELRWHHRDSGRGRASLVADGTGCSVPEGFNGGPSIYDDRLERRYLLWGRRTDSRDGWTAFAEGRVGTIWVPIKTDARWVRLLAYEYVGEYVGSADTHGNSAVLVERLVRLEPYRGEAKEEGS